MSPDSSRPQLVLADTTIHTATCTHARRTTTRPYATDGSAALAAEVVAADLKPCKTCKPISRLAWWERGQR